MAEKREGWGWPSNAKKAHYFVGTRSLCLSWAFVGVLEEGNDGCRGNCAKCRKRLKERNEPANDHRT